MKTDELNTPQLLLLLLLDRHFACPLVCPPHDWSIVEAQWPKLSRSARGLSRRCCHQTRRWSPQKSFRSKKSAARWAIRVYLVYIAGLSARLQGCFYECATLYDTTKMSKFKAAKYHNSVIAMRTFMNFIPTAQNKSTVHSICSCFFIVSQTDVMTTDRLKHKEIYKHSKIIIIITIAVSIHLKLSTRWRSTMPKPSHSKRQLNI